MSVRSAKVVYLMNEHMNAIVKYLEHSYSGAKMMDDVESMFRISRALAALQADIHDSIFKEEFLEKYYMGL